MQNDAAGKEEDEDMPMKKVRAVESEVGPLEESGEQARDDQGIMDVPMEEEKTQDEDLGQMIFSMSRLDPSMSRWAERINSNGKRMSRRSKPEPVADADAASSSVGITPLVQADVSEVYSPPRVTVVAAKTGLNPGSAMDLRTGYDFSKRRIRRGPDNV